MHDQGFRYLNLTSGTLVKSPFYPKNTSNFSNLLWSEAGIKYFRYPGLSQYPQLIHGVFTRWGGVSTPPYDSLNTSYSSGDTRKNVNENLRIIKDTIGAGHLVIMNQCHGDGILALREKSHDSLSKLHEVDAVITDMKSTAILVKQADCQGIMVFDPKRLVLANIHCGWRGNVHNIIGRVISQMKQLFRCEGSDLLAAIGPSLGPCCSEFTTYTEIFPETFERFMVKKNYFDLWAISTWQLIQAGLKIENIELAGICTRCNTDLFYSYRAEGRTGRFASVAVLQ
jgi:hypothetical protein